MLPKQIVSTLDEVLNDTCMKANLPGMALIMSQNGQPIFEKYFGYRDIENKLPVNEDTVFGVASITKSLTALAVMQLEDAGKLSVDDQLILWLPELKMPNQQYGEKIKIHHLLLHTSGLPGLNTVNCARANSVLNDPHGEYLFDSLSLLANEKRIKNVKELMEVMSETEYSLLGPPGSMFNYSNESYALLQEIIERASGEGFIPYVQKNIFQPLGMNRSFFLTSDLKKLQNVTELYAYRREQDNKPSVFHSPAWWDVGDIYSNGSMKTSSSDLMKYLEVFRLDGTVKGERIVSKASIQKMTSAQVTMPTGERYGYGLKVDCLSGMNIFGHGGSVKGVSSHMKVAKEQGITVSVLINIAEAAPEKLAMTSLNHGLQLPDVTDRKFTIYKLSVEQLKGFIGVYQSDEGHKAEIVLADNGIQMKGQDNLLPLMPYSIDSFMTPWGERIKFIMDDVGKVRGLFKGVRFIPKTLSGIE
ncbi:serine hydrolase [Bacillus sp. Bva_UNVM-123]|uniref:serine hydrolase domain-containing protein n=1 Tax=Bacillus sp. Bva_UNVM-123 TaxID=2829798 RepID=UPI00391F6A09